MPVTSILAICGALAFGAYEIVLRRRDAATTSWTGDDEDRGSTRLIVGSYAVVVALDAVLADTSVGGLPGPARWLGVVVMLLVAIFFVSGADAASIVMGTLSERGTLEPSRRTVVFWGVATGAVAAVMLLVGGDDALTGLQTITIVAALPFVLVMIGLSVSLVRDLRSDPMMVRRRYAREAVEAAVITGVTEHGDDFVISVDKDPEAEASGQVAG